MEPWRLWWRIGGAGPRVYVVTDRPTERVAWQRLSLHTERVRVAEQGSSPDDRWWWRVHSRADADAVIREMRTRNPTQQIRFTILSRIPPGWR
jgi:hypothetical protein